MSDPDDFDWTAQYIDFSLSDARIIALVDEEPAIVETGLSLLLSEGRAQEFGRSEDGTELMGLKYHFQFSTVGNHEFEATSGMDGVVVITGKHECGVEMQIKGIGYFGYDDKGLPEGCFDDPPEIRFLVGPSLSDRLKESARSGAEEMREVIKRVPERTRH